MCYNYSSAVAQFSIFIAPFNISAISLDKVFESLAYINVTPTSSTSVPYYGYGSIVGNNNLNFGNPTQTQNWSNYPELYAGDEILAYSNNIENPYAQIWYVESDI